MLGKYDFVIGTRFYFESFPLSGMVPCSPSEHYSLDAKEHSGRVFYPFSCLSSNKSRGGGSGGYPRYLPIVCQPVVGLDQFIGVVRLAPH